MILFYKLLLESRTKRQSAQLIENDIWSVIEFVFDLSCGKTGFGKSEKQTELCRIFVKSLLRWAHSEMVLKIIN